MLSFFIANVLCDSLFTGSSLFCVGIREEWMGQVSRGRILGRNWDKSLKTFPPCYLQSPLLMDFTPLPP
jgi:hypothetical protein